MYIYISAFEVLFITILLLKLIDSKAHKSYIYLIMDKRLISRHFGHFLTGGNLEIWAEMGVPVQCGRGFYRDR